VADRIEVTLAGYNGEYEIDWEGAPPTGDELHQIKQFSGVRAGEVGEGLRAGDYDLIVILAVIAMQRAGKFKTLQVLDVAADLRSRPAGFIRYVADMEDEAEDPQRAPASESDESGDDGAKLTSSGLSSENGSESPAEIPEPTGTPV
jgi:hypothetical protein